jgi:hypothetical protein
MSAEVKITQTDAGWKVVATDSTDIKVEVDGQDLIVRLSPTQGDSDDNQPLAVSLAQ